MHTKALSKSDFVEVVLDEEQGRAEGAYMQYVTENAIRDRDAQLAVSEGLL